MLSADTLPKEYLQMVKRHLNITWDDEDTDAKIVDKMLDAEITLNHLLGAEIDYFAPGMERRLYFNYLLYDWNDCLNEFETAYRIELNRVRRFYEVKGANNDDS